jgi:hypothetical protein
VEIAIGASLFAKWNVDVNTGHVAKLWLKFKIVASKVRYLKLGNLILLGFL